MKWNEKIFRKNDIRGIYKQDFDLDFVKALAWAVINFYQQHTSFELKTGKKLTIAIGHDSRLSSPEIAKHLSKSLAQAGADVQFLGMISSPACYFASYFYSNIHASIVVTASHNPPNFNGFKIMLNKETLSDEKILQLKQIIINNNFSSFFSPGKITPFNIEKDYISYFSKSFTFPQPTLNKTAIASPVFSQSIQNKQSLNIGIDCGNGASGPLAKRVFENINLPVKVHWLYVEPDGRFPNHPPDPSNENNLKTLQTIVNKQNLDFGAAFDGDGDRLFIVGNSGKILHGDELMFIFISELLENKLKNEKEISIVADVKCADWFFDFLKKKNIQTIMWKSGHSLTRKKTLETKASFGGEFSGHFFFMDHFFPIDDGLYALFRLINICLKTNKNPEELILKKDSIETNEIRISTNISEAQKKIKRLKDYYMKRKSYFCSIVDGLRISTNKAWGLVRLSNTQSEWTFRFGGKTKKDLEKIQNHFYQLLDIL